MLTTERRLECSYGKTLLILWLISNMIFLIEAGGAGAGSGGGESGKGRNSGRGNNGKTGEVYIVYGPHGKAATIKALKAVGADESAIIYVYDNISGFAAKISAAQAKKMEGVAGVSLVKKSQDNKPI